MKDSFVKRFLLTCNPWFLASTLILLLGIYLVYVDPKLVDKDVLQMNISFSSLQLYEFLCLGVIFLFRRIKLYYDSVFLIVILSMLLFIPFITFNQALQYDNNQLEVLGYLALGMAAVKLVLLKVGFKNLNLPWIFLASGFLMLIMNFSLPFAMKGLNLEEDTAGADFIYDVFSIAIPVIGFLGYAAMYNIKSGKEVYESKWLPITIFQCFFTVTLINLMSVMYVYDIAYNSLFYSVSLLVSAFLSLHPTLGLKPLVKKIILAASVLLAVLMLGPEFKAHLIVVLFIALAFAVSMSDRWVGLFVVSLLMILAIGKLTIVNLSYVQMCLVASLVTSSVLAWQKQHWAYLLLPGVALELLLLSNSMTDRSLLVFLPMTLVLLICQFWKDEVFKKTESLIISLSLLWALLGIVCHLNSGWEFSFTCGAVILFVQLFKRYYLKLNQPLFMIALSVLVTLLWPGEELVRLLIEQSFSIIVIILSFVVFLSGTYATYTKKVKQLKM